MMQMGNKVQWQRQMITAWSNQMIETNTMIISRMMKWSDENAHSEMITNFNAKRDKDKIIIIVVKCPKKASAQRLSVVYIWKS